MTRGRWIGRRGVPHVGMNTVRASESVESALVVGYDVVDLCRGVVHSVPATRGSIDQSLGGQARSSTMWHLSHSSYDDVDAFLAVDSSPCSTDPDILGPSQSAFGR